MGHSGNQTMSIRIPTDFSEKAHLAATKCPAILTDTSTHCGLEPGTIVFGSNNGIEDTLPQGKTLRLVLFGFTKPHGYAVCLDRDGKWWTVHPEALRRENRSAGEGLGVCGCCGFVFLRSYEIVRWSPFRACFNCQDV